MAVNHAASVVATPWTWSRLRQPSGTLNRQRAALLSWSDHPMTVADHAYRQRTTISNAPLWRLPPHTVEVSHCDANLGRCRIIRAVP